MMPCRPRLAFVGSVVLVVVLSLATPLRGQTLLYSGGEWGFESGFYWTSHMLAGQCSNPPPDWIGPPYDWTVSYHYGIDPKKQCVRFSCPAGSCYFRRELLRPLCLVSTAVTWSRGTKVRLSELG